MARVDWGGEPAKMVFPGPGAVASCALLFVGLTAWRIGTLVALWAAGGIAVGVMFGWALLGSSLAFDGWVIAYVKNAKGKRRYIVGKEEKPEVVEQPKAVVRWL